MDTYMLAAPEGFNAAVNVLNDVAGAGQVLTELVSGTLSFLDSHHGALSGGMLASKLAASGIKVDDKAAQSVINATVYVLRGALQHTASGEALTATCRANTDMSAACADTIGAAYDAWRARKAAGDSEGKGSEDGVGGGAVAAATRTLSAGSVVGLDWRVGVSLRSSSCKDLSSPFVTLVLRVADADGRVKAHPMELTIPEYQQFSATLREVAAALDRL